MSIINKYMFREYDLRGKISGDELNEQTMELIGRGFGTFLKRRGVSAVVIGYDSRRTSPKFKEAVVRGLTSTGCDVIDIGMTLAPILYFAQYHLKCKGGVMVTASHNPNDWSGLKLAQDYSKTLLGDELQEVRKIIEEDDYIVGKGAIKKADVKKAYIKDVASRVNLARKMKVVIECGNGTAGAFAPDVLREIGCEVVEVCCEVDPRFPNHFPNPELKEAKELLSKKVLENHADIGCSYDGDGDRLGVVDEKGNNVWTDQVLIILSRQVLENQPGAKIVFDVKCTEALVEDIKAHGGVPIMWKTGHSYIKRKAQEIDAAFAGERSGHIFYRQNYYGFDDAIFSSVKLIEYLSQQKKPFSKLLETTPKYYSSPTIHVPCPDSKKYEIVDKLVEEFKKEYRVIDVNGARVYFEDGWGLVRASSNEPVLVLVFESKNQESLEKYKKIFRDKFKKYPEISSVWKNE